MLRTDKSVLLYAQEATYGDIPTTGWRRFGIHDNASLPDPDISWTPYYSLRSQNRTQIIRGKQTLAASIPNITLQSKYPLYPLFPPNDTASAASISLAHELWDNFGVSWLKRRWGGGRVNKATVSIKEGEALQLSLDEVLFQHMEHNRSQASSSRYLPNAFYPTDPGPSDNYRYTFNNVTINGLNLTFARVKALQVTVNNNLYPYYAIREGNYDHAMQPARIITGVTEYKMILTVDLHETELGLWDYLMNQGSPQGIGPVAGATFQFSFTNGSEPFIMHCSTTATNASPGTVFEKMEMPISIQSSGYYTATFTGNVDRVFILG